MYALKTVFALLVSATIVLGHPAVAAAEKKVEMRSTLTLSNGVIVERALFGMEKRATCCCNESSCSGPACCANGSCGKDTSYC